MRHKTIRTLRTRIYNKRQLVIVEFDNKEFVFITPNNIKQNTGLEVYELELLIGSTMRIEFYKKGERMFNGQVCQKENILVKEYFFELAEPIERLRMVKRSQLLAYEQITDIFHFKKFERDNVGIKTSNGKVIFMPLKSFEMQSKIEKSEQHILVGSYIRPEYYKKGERLPNGKEVTEDDKLLRWLNLRYSDKVEAMHEHFETSIGYSDGANSSGSHSEGSGPYGYGSWDEMALHETSE